MSIAMAMVDIKTARMVTIKGCPRRNVQALTTCWFKAKLATKQF